MFQAITFLLIIAKQAKKIDKKEKDSKEPLTSFKNEENNDSQRPLIVIDKMYKITPKDDKKSLQEDEPVPTYNRLNLSQSYQNNIVVGENQSAQDYLKLTAYQVVKSYMLGTCDASKATGVIPDRICFISGTSAESWKRTFEILNHAKQNPNTKILLLWAAGTTST